MKKSSKVSKNTKPILATNNKDSKDGHNESQDYYISIIFYNY